MTPFQMIIASPAGAGKTNAMLNLVREIGPSFEHIILLCRNYPDEPLHRLMVNTSEKLLVIKSSSELPDQPPQQTLLVVDDISDCPEEFADVRSFAARAPDASIVYVTQSYRCMPRRIRESARYIVTSWRIRDERDFQAIQMNARVSMSELRASYDTLKLFSFLVIDCHESTVRAVECAE